jgi:hypothetical protein
MKAKLFIITSVLTVLSAVGNYFQFNKMKELKKDSSERSKMLSLAEDRALNCSYELSKKTLELNQKNVKIDSMRIALSSQVIKSGARKIKITFK